LCPERDAADDPGDADAGYWSLDIAPPEVPPWKKRKVYRGSFK
jgi:hypothetical protein